MQQVPAPRAEGAGKGYNSTFEELYETYRSKVFAFVYSRTGNVELAKDLTAEVFEKAYAHGASVRDQAAYASWLFTIARNVIIGHFRRSKREVCGMARLKDSLWDVECPRGPEDSALKGDLVRQLVRCLGMLPPRDRELLSLKFDAELTNAQIGGVLGMSDINVRVSVFRALGRLRAAMEREEAPTPVVNRSRRGSGPSHPQLLTGNTKLRTA